MGTRHTTRYVLVGRSTIRVSGSGQTASAAIPIVANATPDAQADVLDISRGGAKLALQTSLQIGTRLTLHFDELAVAAQATVLWSRPEQDNRWWAACAFDPPLADDVLEQLLAAGYLERRRDPREPVEIPAMARWRLGEPGPVGIRDFSAGGLCLSSPHVAERGQRLLLHLGEANDPQTSAMVEVQWCIEFQEGYLIGCSFLHRDGLAATRRMAAIYRANSGVDPATSLPSRARFTRIKSLWNNLAQWADRER